MNMTFKEEHIIPVLKARNSFEAIGELVEHLVSVGTILPEVAESIAAAVKQRENSMSTGIGFGLAIPHAATPLVHEIVLAFGRSLTGIDFDSVDKQLVQHVVLIITPAGEKQKHLVALARISRLFHDRAIRAALENASTSDAVSDILNGSHLARA